MFEGWRSGVWGWHRIWVNPSELGHAFIGIRKSTAEDRIIERMETRWAEAMVVSAIVGGR